MMMFSMIMLTILFIAWYELEEIKTTKPLLYLLIVWIFVGIIHMK